MKVSSVYSSATSCSIRHDDSNRTHIPRLWPRKTLVIRSEPNFVVEVSGEQKIMENHDQFYPQNARKIPQNARKIPQTPTNPKN